MKSKQSQNARILKHLKHGYLTAWSAFIVYKCTRLSGRIYDLRTGAHDGECWPIKTKMIYKDGNHYAKYYLVK